MLVRAISNDLLGTRVVVAALSAAAKMCVNTSAGTVELLAAGAAAAGASAAAADDAQECQAAAVALFSELLCPPREIDEDERPTPATMAAAEKALLQSNEKMVETAKAALVKCPKSGEVERVRSACARLELALCPLREFS